MKFEVELIKEFLTEHPNIGSRTAASALMALYPEIFINYNSVYGKVRYYRGEQKNKNCVSPVAIRTEEQKIEAMAWNKALPESDYQEIETFTFPAGSNRILILSDIHLPYQDNEALSIAIDYGIKNGANCVFLNGDTIDMYQASRFIKDPRLRSLSGELQMTRDFFETINEAIPGPAWIS